MVLPLLAIAIAAFVVAFASAAFSVYQQQKMKEKAAEAADRRKGFEIPTENSGDPVALVYGRALVGGTRSFHATSSKFEYVAPNSDKQYLTGHSGSSGYTSSYTVFDAVLGVVTGGSRTASPSASGYMSHSLGGDRNDFLFFQQAMCVGPINSVRDFVIDGSRYIDDVSLGSYGEIQDKDGDTHNGIKAAMRLDYHYNGGADAVMARNFPERADAKFTDLAYLSAIFRIDRDNPQFSGVPSVQSLIEGRKVYTWAAGVKSASRVYSNNPSWCLLDYLMDPVWGKGVPIEELDIASFEAAADVCDTVVQSNVNVGGKFWRPTDGNGSISTRNLPLYECNIILDTSKPIRENIEALLTTMGDGRLVWSGGRYKLSIQYPATNAAIVLDEPVLTDDDLELGQEVEIHWPNAQERFNYCVMKFHNEHENFKEDSVSWPPKYDGQYWQGIGGSRYGPSNKSSWDKPKSGAELLNRYAVWSGTGNSTTMTFRFVVHKEDAGTYTLKVAGDDTASISVYDDVTNVLIKTLTGGTWKSLKSTSITIGNASVDKVYRAVVTASNTENEFKGAAAVIEDSSRVLWNTREPTYDKFILVNRSKALYETFLAEDGGMELEAVVFGEGITDPYHALAKAEEIVRTSRSAFGITFKRIIKEGLNEPGDFIQLNSDDLNLGNTSPLYLRVDNAKVVGERTMELKATRFDSSQLAWNVKDDQPSRPPSIYSIGVPQPEFIVYEDYQAPNTDSSGRLTCGDTGFEGMAGYIWYMHRAGIDALTDDNRPIFTEIGRSDVPSFTLPAIGASSAYFAVRTYSTSGRRSDYTTTDLTLALDLSHAWGRYVELTATDFTFNRTATGGTTPSQITVTAGATGFTLPVYRWYIDGVLQAGQTASTLVVPAFSNVNAKRVQVRVNESGDLSKVNSDTLILYYMAGGFDAYVGYLTNESHNVIADSAGVVSDYSGASGSFVVMLGTLNVSSSFVVSIAAGGNPQALTVNISGQTYTVSGGLDPNEASATLLLRAEGTGTHTGVILTKQFSLAKAIGINYRLVATAQTMKYDGNNIVVPAQTITFTAQKTGTAAPIVVELLRQPGGQAINPNTYLGSTGTKSNITTTSFTQTGNDLTLTGSNFNSALQAGDTGLMVRTTCGALLDQMTVIKVVDGAQGVVGPPGSAGPAVQITPSPGLNFIYQDGQLSPAGQVITLTATLQNLIGTISWTTSPNVKSGTGTTFTLTPADLGSNDQVVATATCSGVSASVTVGKNNTVTVVPSEPYVPTAPVGGGGGYFAGRNLGFHINSF